MAAAGVPEELLAKNQTASTVADASYWEKLCPHLTVSFKDTATDASATSSNTAGDAGDTAASAETDRSRGNEESTFALLQLWC